MNFVYDNTIRLLLSKLCFNVKSASIAFRSQYPPHVTTGCTHKDVFTAKSERKVDAPWRFLHMRQRVHPRPATCHSHLELTHVLDPRPHPHCAGGLATRPTRSARSREPGAAASLDDAEARDRLRTRTAAPRPSVSPPPAPPSLLIFAFAFSSSLFFSRPSSPICWFFALTSSSAQFMVQQLLLPYTFLLPL